MGAAEAWRKQVEAHHAQTEAAIAKAGKAHGDLWSGIAEGFRDDPRRTDDPVIEHVGEWLTPQSTVLDVGGGAGRYALPLALRCREVTVVEPSEAMQNALRESAKEHGHRERRRKPRQVGRCEGLARERSPLRACRLRRR